MFEKGDIASLRLDDGTYCIGEIGENRETTNHYDIELISLQDGKHYFVCSGEWLELICKSKYRKDKMITDTDRIYFLQTTINNVNGDSLWIRTKQGFKQITDENIISSVDSLILCGGKYE